MAEATTFSNATQILEPFRGIKRVTIEEYFTSGHRTCQGCESALVMKLMVKAAGPRTIVLGSTGAPADARRPALMVVSGRGSFEIVQKAAVAGIPVVSCVSAPSTLAVDLAAAAGVALIGFARGESFTVYTHPERIREG